MTMIVLSSYFTLVSIINGHIIGCLINMSHLIGIGIFIYKTHLKKTQPCYIQFFHVVIILLSLIATTVEITHPDQDQIVTDYPTACRSSGSTHNTDDSSGSNNCCMLGEYSFDADGLPQKQFELLLHVSPQQFNTVVTNYVYATFQNYFLFSSMLQKNKHAFDENIHK